MPGTVTATKVAKYNTSLDFVKTPSIYAPTSRPSRPRSIRVQCPLLPTNDQVTVVQKSSSIVHPQLRATDQYVVEWYMDQFYDVSNGSHNEKSHSYSSSDVEEFATISYDMLESNVLMRSTDNSGSYALCIC